MKGVLVIGSLPRIVTPVARSLAARGIPVHGASMGTAGRRIRSRAFRSFTCLGNEEHHPEQFFMSLRKVIAERDIDTVIPCGDEVIRGLAHHDEALRQLVHYCGPAPDACRQVLEKRETLAIAKSVGIPVPAEYSIRDSGILEQLKGDIKFPVVVKPQNKEAETVTGIKSEIVQDYAQLKDYFDRYPEFGTWFLFQEYLPGHGVAVEMLMHNGDALAVFQHRRVREYPVRGGVSVLAVSESPDRELVAYATALLHALAWQGVAMVEFRRDPQTGRVGLMEVNGRFWGSVTLSLFCGINFPYYVWQQAHGDRPSPPVSYPVGARFRWLAGDMKRVYETFASGSGGALRGILEFAREFAPAKEATWSWSDPVPALEELARALASVVFMAAGAAAKQMVPGRVYRRAKALRHAGGSRAIQYLERRFVSRPGATLVRGGPVRSVVFICHGNIIRSPMAAAVFRALGTGIKVESAGTAAIPGRDVDARAAQIAREFGISLEGHTATRISKALVAGSELLVVMDYLNYISLVATFPEAESKTILLGVSDRKVVEIDDPYEGSVDDIRAALRHVHSSVGELANALTLKPHCEANST